jgi:hypothetical protein
MRRDHGKRLWAFLARTRDPAPEMFLFADDGDRRALSLALAVCDVLGLDRAATVFWPGAPEEKYTKETPPPNRHVHGVCRASRALVCGAVVTAFRPAAGPGWEPLWGRHPGRL